MSDVTTTAPAPVNGMLGKKAAKLIKGLPALGKYTLTLPSAPPEANYGLALKQLGEMGNNSLGDCSCASCGHAIETWTSLTQAAEVVVPDATIIDLYAKSCGYVPGDPLSDNGGVLSDVLKYWYQNGIGGHPLAGFAGIRPGNRASIRDAIYLFGVASVGVQLPLAAQNQTVWDVAPDAVMGGDNAVGSWGGHAIPLVAYDQDTVTCITWGALKKMTWNWLDAYMDEGYGLLSKDWLNASGNAPPGFDFDILAADMMAIKAGS